MSKVPRFSDFGVLFADITFPVVPARDGPLLGAVLLAARLASPSWVRFHFWEQKTVNAKAITAMMIAFWGQQSNSFISQVARREGIRRGWRVDPLVL
jgi:hypothetical protein